MSRRYGGQAVVEFALSLPVLLLLILGVLDAGRGVIAAVSINNAAREGARYAALHLHDGTCSSLNCQTEAHAVVSNSALGIDISQLQFVESVTPGGVINLVLTYPFAAAAPIIGSALGSTTLTATSSMLSH